MGDPSRWPGTVLRNKVKRLLAEALENKQEVSVLEPAFEAAASVKTQRNRTSEPLILESSEAEDVSNP